MLKNSQAAQKGPDARRRPTAAREAYSLYVERAAGGANEADAAFSAVRALVEDDDAASHLAPAHRREALVDLVELPGAADELVDLEPPLEVEVHQLREIEVRADGAVHRALECLLLERHRVGRDGRAHAHGRHADDDGGAAGPNGVEDLQRGRLAADGVERVVGAAAAREGAHLVDDLVAGGVDRVGGAEVARERELGVEEVARDDLAGAGE